MRAVYWITLILTVVGGINWGLIGAANINLVALIFGDMTPLAKLVYVLVGVSAIVTLLLALRANGMVANKADI